MDRRSGMKQGSVVDGLYDDICHFGRAIAEVDGLELPDEWPNLVQEWIFVHRRDAMERGVNENDVTAAFEALELGWPFDRRS